jgi:hypothetical protein
VLKHLELMPRGRHQLHLPALQVRRPLLQRLGLVVELLHQPRKLAELHLQVPDPVLVRQQDVLPRVVDLGQRALLIHWFSGDHVTGKLIRVSRR